MRKVAERAAAAEAAAAAAAAAEAEAEAAAAEGAQKQQPGIGGVSRKGTPQKTGAGAAASDLRSPLSPAVSRKHMSGTASTVGRPGVSPARPHMPGTPSKLGGSSLHASGVMPTVGSAAQSASPTPAPGAQPTARRLGGPSSLAVSRKGGPAGALAAAMLGATSLGPASREGGGEGADGQGGAAAGAGPGSDQAEPEPVEPLEPDVPLQPWDLFGQEALQAAEYGTNVVALGKVGSEMLRLRPMYDDCFPQMATGHASTCHAPPNTCFPTHVQVTCASLSYEDYMALLASIKEETFESLSVVHLMLMNRARRTQRELQDLAGGWVGWLVVAVGQPGGWIWV